MSGGADVPDEGGMQWQHLLQPESILWVGLLRIRVVMPGCGHLYMLLSRPFLRLGEAIS